MGIIPMMEAPFMMFFMIFVYYIQSWYYMYSGKNNTTIKNQYLAIIKGGLAISAACLTRYEGWLLPLVFVSILLIVIAITRASSKVRRSRSRIVIPLALASSLTGIVCWIVWNYISFNDPLYFITGPISAAAQASSRPFSEYLRFHFIFALSVIWNVAKNMYGIPVLAISILGFGSYIYFLLNKQTRNKKYLFGFLTALILLVPILTDIAAIMGGSAEIYPTSNAGWYNGRYLIFLSPMLVFCSVSLFMFVTARMKISLVIVTTGIMVISFSLTIVYQPLQLGKTTAMNDRFALLPFTNKSQAAFEIGQTLSRMTTGGKPILLFTPSQESQEIMLESGIQLKDFIDPPNGHFWNASKDRPWLHGVYVVLKKHHNSNNDISAIGYWLPNNQTFMRHYHLSYEDSNYKILSRVGS
jgi:hypothetical protein